MTATELSKYQMFLQNPSIYVGRCSNVIDESYVFNISADINQSKAKFLKANQNQYKDTLKDKLSIEKLNYSSILLKMIDELLMNCLDNYQASLKGKNKMTYIKVNVENNIITISNNGNAISLNKTKSLDGQSIYNPELIFSKLFTSTHYSKKDENIAGMNGIGAKIATVFSKELKLKIINNGTLYEQSFKATNKTIEASTPMINKLSTKDKHQQASSKDKYNESIDNITEITFEADKNKIKDLTDAVFNDTIKMLTKRLIDIKLIANSLKIYYNNIEVLEELTIEKLFNLYSINSFVKFNHGFIAKSNSFKQFSIINGISVSRGGTHINSIINNITDYVEKKLKRKNLRTIIKSSLFIIFISNCKQPVFTSQDKVELDSGFDSNILTESELKKIYNELNLEQYIKSKEREKLTASNSTTVKRLQIKDLTDATYAGTKKSNECVLFLAEGLSALSFAKIGMKTVLDANFYGCYPVGGKILNVRKSKLEKANKNDVLINIEKILGLKANSKNDSLRYGKVVILKDADTDGAEIMGLIINFFHFQYPELLKRDFLYEFLTPMIKLLIPNNHLNRYQFNHTENIIKRATYSIIPFYNEQEFNSFKAKYPTVNEYKTEYIKGLAGNEDFEVSHYFKNRDSNEIELCIDDDLKDTIEIVYGKDASKRKDWMIDSTDKFLNRIKKINISDFLNNDVLMFSFENCKRCIPSAIDGLKPSQRKVLWTLMNSKNKDDFKKVFMLTGDTSSFAYYNHGDASMNETIIKLGQTYAGSNNFNIIEPYGFFGSREYLGNDHGAARYIKCRLNPKVFQLIPIIDINLLEANFEDNVKIEPKYFIPVLPLVLINGCCGIGTGYSTYIPMYSMSDIKSFTLHWIKTGEFINITPKVNSFKGSIKKTDNGFIIEGVMKKIKDTLTYDLYEITEIPYDISISSFDNILKELYNDKKILNYEYGDKRKNKEGINSVNYIVKVSKGTNLYDLLPMTSKKAMSNMTLFDSNENIIKYENIEDIFIEWSCKRTELYELRKQYIINNLNDKLKILKNKLRFIIELGDVVKDMIDEDTLIECLKDESYDLIDNSYNYLLTIPIKQFTEKNVDNLRNDIKKLEDELKDITNESIEDMWIKDIEAIEV